MNACWEGYEAFGLKKKGKKLVPNCVPIKTKLTDYSNPKTVYKNAKKYLGKDVIIQPSTNKNKKYMVFDPNTENWVHFGQFNPPMEDFTKHQDEDRRQRYLARATNIKGDWKNDKYSPNQMSLRLLWNWNGKNTI